MRTRRRRRDTSRNLAVKVRSEFADIHSIRPYPGNPRDNDQAVSAIATSIRTYGFVIPIIVDRAGVIVAGHTRYRAAQELGLDEVPIIRATHLNEDQIKQFRIIDNKTAEIARWDFDALAAEMTALSDSGVDFTDFGWSQQEVDCLTEAVASDCLTAGAVTEMEDDHRRRRREHRAPSQARFVNGEFVFFVPQEVYRRWASALRAEHDYDEAEITRALKDRLGLTPYEEQHRQETG